MNFLQKLRGAYVITDLVVWQFTHDKEIVSHIAEDIAKVIIVSYNMGNFGPDSFKFGVQKEDGNDE